MIVRVQSTSPFCGAFLCCTVIVLFLVFEESLSLSHSHLRCCPSSSIVLLPCVPRPSALSAYSPIVLPPLPTTMIVRVQSTSPFCGAFLCCTVIVLFLVSAFVSFVFALLSFFFFYARVPRPFPGREAGFCLDSAYEPDAVVASAARNAPARAAPGAGEARAREREARPPQRCLRRCCRCCCFRRNNNKSFFLVPYYPPLRGFTTLSFLPKVFFFSPPSTPLYFSPLTQKA